VAGRSVPAGGAAQSDSRADDGGDSRQTKASDSTGGEPARDAVPLEDIQFTIYKLLGVDANKELVAFGTRPIEIIKDGNLVKGILS
jgi:hypothetical protein